MTALSNNPTSNSPAKQPCIKSKDEAWDVKHNSL